MLKKILIDAAHDEEIRLVLTENSVVRSFDYHNNDRVSIKGNVYLAKITRVEPSLQAAFVEYGGNKQGFLPFAEIHPDYYQLPKEDKDTLLDLIIQSRTEEASEEESVEESEDKDTSLQRPVFYKKYKIQDVIKKDQVMLVQITKEERGNKGASLTTYISLAGRYCVLLPNSTKAGGVSRKIEDAEERGRLKLITQEFAEQSGNISSIIIRTAGSYKTKAELKRDIGYLSRLWNNIRGHTLSSIAPTFIHEEGDIVKKAIRDLYDNDVEEVLIVGSSAYENAKNFTKLLLPKHVDKIKQYNGAIPLFTEYAVEEQLGLLYDSVVQLDSGGYIVINQTEALVAIDVNSGKFTSERSIESTALKNNLEAAKEIYRQVRLRDLSGLIVIDFIDMAEAQNRKAVEKALKEVFAADKAKTQIGKISEFGLLEMSRQRLRQSFAEANMLACNHCAGRGRVRPENVTAIAIMRAIESEIVTGEFNIINVSSSKNLILYLLNHKCAAISSISNAYGAQVRFNIDEEAGADGFFLEGIKQSDPLKKTALSTIDHEPYRLEELDSDVVRHKGAPSKKPDINVKVAKTRIEKEQAVEQTVPREARNPRRRKRFRDGMKQLGQHSNGAPAQSNGPVFASKSADDAEIIDPQSSITNHQGSAEMSKNHSLLRDIWKKIMD